MIVYELRCDGGHGFEAWFRNADAYDQQHETKQIACPVCGDTGVSKAPMAPRIARGQRGREKSVSGQPNPEQVKMVMSKIAELNKHIAETCDYVGNAFPEEARKIHYGEIEHREIYGEATQSEAAELHEEGIAIASIPWVRRDSN